MLVPSQPVKIKNRARTVSLTSADRGFFYTFSSAAFEGGPVSSCRRAQNGSFPTGSYESRAIEGHCLQPFMCPRIPSHPANSISGGDHDSVITHRYKPPVAEGDASQALVRARIPRGPGNAVRGCPNNALIAHRYKEAISVGHMVEVERTSGRTPDPVRPVR